MSYLADWQKAKKEFEDKTKSKKPSESFLGVFRKSSGLESACKALDESLKKPTIDGTQKALVGFVKAYQDYCKTVDKAADKGAKYDAELKKLVAVLEDIVKRYSVDKQAALSNAPVPLSDILGPHLKELTSGPLLGLASVKGFGTDKRIGQSGVDGQPFKDALDCQNAFKASIRGYQAGLADIAKEAKKAYQFKDGVARAVALCESLIECVQSHDDKSAFFQLLTWMEVQRSDFLERGSKADYEKFINGGPVTNIITQLRADLEAEATRLGALEGKIRSLHR